MAKVNGLDSRIEFRIDSDTKSTIISYCKDKGYDLSEFSRDAIVSYIKEKKFVSELLRSLQGDTFFKEFSEFYRNSSEFFKGIINDLIGSEEEKLIEKLPEVMLCSVNVISDKGIKKKEQRCKKI